MSTAYDISFAAGMDERQPVLIVLDTSGSMGNPAAAPRIDEVNHGLTVLFDGVRSNARLRARVELCLITFGSRVRVYDPVTATLVAPETVASDRVFVPVDRLTPPPLRADGFTNLPPAVDVALELAGERQRALRARFLPVRRPLIWLLTDGAPSDEQGRPLTVAELTPVAERLRRAEAAQAPEGCVFQAIGVRGADPDMLDVLAPGAAYMLEAMSFTDILQFLLLSSDRVASGATADETHRQIAQQAEMRAARDALSALEEGLL